MHNWAPETYQGILIQVPSNLNDAARDFLKESW